MIKLAIAFVMTSLATAIALSPMAPAVSGIDALFILFGLFVMFIASLNAVQNALR